ncbi:acid-sensing ion channel 4-A-like [Branchiostoma lanceolatum]|uniref:acid-sensing ion channel 4-A-like n=1 Tax=Branchiostoma lanceolatum TaxID=7740 RepID=UPI00345434AD
MTKYSTSVSYAGWPNKLTEEHISTQYGIDPAYMAENGVVFSVFYEELNYQKIRQLKAMDEGQLASNIGGMMGLFIGASVLSILEVWEYLWQRVKGLLRRNRRPPVNDDKSTAYDLEKGTSFNNTSFNK